MKRNPKVIFCSYLLPQQDGCLLWRGSINKYGYGKFTTGGKTYGAHRFSYEIFVGPIPAGLQLDHLCRNRACVNPAHLEPVTCRENLMRGKTLQRLNSEKTHCPAGHEYSIENTYRYPDGRRRCIKCRKISDNKPGPKKRRMLYKRKLRAENIPDPDPMKRTR